MPENNSERGSCMPGPIVLLGSGETSSNGQRVFDRILRTLPVPPAIALLETPAGFELNSAQVIQRVADFLKLRLQNYHPAIAIIPARKRDSDFSPDDPALAEAIFHSDLIFMGPGSPTYAVRQLIDSVVWHSICARQRLGAAVVLASAAVIAAGEAALPVYEIYKVGEELHWKRGLDLLGIYGLHLIFVPHWNNTDGGAELDTSRCFMGKERFSSLVSLLPPGPTIIGIDEETALIVDINDRKCHVLGKGGVTLIHTGQAHDRESHALADKGLGMLADIRDGQAHRIGSGESFSINDLGELHIPQNGDGLPAEVWQRAVNIQQSSQDQGSPPEEVLVLAAQRQTARMNKDWTVSDILRGKIVTLGWIVDDTPQGYRLLKKPQG